MGHVFLSMRQYRGAHKSLSSTNHSNFGTTTAHIADEWNPPRGDHTYGAQTRAYASDTYN
ncbi:MAG: hypothetical protein OXP12_09580 [Thaumarchaeota archaeon]|nr:hypothetical protein [Nitrososphaerota archaeon]